MRHIKEFNQLFENTQELTQEQKDWLDKCSTKGTWKLNPQTGLVDVVGNFDCKDQNLTDFKGVRFGSVSGHFNCSNNQLTSLEEAPKSVGLGFNCANNNLTSLEGAPQKLEYTSFLHCSDNPISEKSIKGVLRRMSKKAISLEQAVAEYWKSIPKDDRPYLAKHHPDLSPEEKRGYLALERLKTRVI